MLSTTAIGSSKFAAKLCQTIPAVLVTIRSQKFGMSKNNYFTCNYLERIQLL